MCPLSIGKSQQGHRITVVDGDAASVESTFSGTAQFDFMGVGMGGEVSQV